jgi:hypothetical protein
LRHILEMTASRSPNTMLERNGGDKDDDEADESDHPLDLDDSQYMKPPISLEDGEDEGDDA